MFAVVRVYVVGFIEGYESDVDVRKVPLMKMKLL